MNEYQYNATLLLSMMMTTVKFYIYIKILDDISKEKANDEYC